NSSSGQAYFALSSDSMARALVVYLQFNFVAGGVSVPLQFGSLASPGGFFSSMDGAKPFAPDTWYHVEIDIDWIGSSYAVSVDGNPQGQVTPFSSGGFLRLDVFTTDPGVADFDDIQLLR